MKNSNFLSVVLISLKNPGMFIYVTILKYPHNDIQLFSYLASLKSLYCIDYVNIALDIVY